VLQTRFHGVTGIVAFDENGFRRDFKLNVLELNLNNPVRKVYCRSLVCNAGAVLREARWPQPPVRGLHHTAYPMKFLVSVTGHLG